MSETPEMVERVARAMWERRRAYSFLEHGIELDAWGDGAIPRANGIMFEARAAIEAMREPTEAMLVAAEEAAPELMSFAEKHNSPSYAAYRAMIDAALAPAKQVNE